MVVACSGDDAVSIGTNQDNFCSQIADVVCHNVYQCCTESEIENYLNVSDPRTELQCRDDVTRDCERDAPEVRDSLKAGRVTFDPAKLNACLTAVLAPDGVCSQVVTDYPWKEACDIKNVPWVGTVATDGQCFFSFDCAGSPDSFCGPDQKCHMKPGAGFPCSTGGVCASAYYCGSNNTCTQKLAVGAACLTGQVCEKDLFCDSKGTTVTTDDVCAAKQPGGAACFGDQGCSSGDCISGLCQGSTFQTCYADTGCLNHCAGLANQNCGVSGDCGRGFCSGNTSLTCYDTAECTAQSAGTCGLYPYTCVPTDCVGDSVGVCTSAIRTADYCTNFANIPHP
jgi:hypothetical protein